MIYCFDLDNTLCNTIDKKYDKSEPISDMIDRVNRLYDDGNEIVIFTARGMGRFNKVVKKVYEEYYDLTKNQVDSWGLKYHNLILGKPSFDYFIDDKNLTIDNFKNIFPLSKGFIAGSFDVIHPGYIDMFEFMKKNCDYLIVGLHSDPNIERKNKLKPILSVDDRKKILNSIKYIDEIIVYDTEKDLFNILLNKSINVRFLGDDYIGKEHTGSDINIPIIYINRSHGWSSTAFKQKIYESMK